MTAGETIKKVHDMTNTDGFTYSLGTSFNAGSIGMAQTATTTQSLPNTGSVVTFNELKQSVDYGRRVGYVQIDYDDQPYYNRAIEHMKQRMLDDWYSNMYRRVYAPPYGWTVIGIDTNETKEKDMSISSKLRNINKDEDQRLLEKYGIVNADGTLTQEGHDVVLDRVFATVKAAVVTDLKKLDAEATKSKKS